MSDDDLKKELERLRSENAALKKGAATPDQISRALLYTERNSGEQKLLGH